MSTVTRSRSDYENIRTDFRVHLVKHRFEFIVQKHKSVLFDFKDLPGDVKSKLIDTYCLDLYGVWCNCGIIARTMLTHFTLPGEKYLDESEKF